MFKIVMENPQLDSYILGLKPGKLDALAKAADEESGRPTTILVGDIHAQAFHRLAEDKETEHEAEAGPHEAAASNAGAQGGMQVGSLSEARTPDVQVQGHDVTATGASEEGQAAVVAG